MLNHCVRSSLVAGLIAACGIAGAPALAEIPYKADPRVGVTPHSVVKMVVDSGPVANNGMQPTVVWSKVVSVPNATWMRLYFSELTLTTDQDMNEFSYLRITNLREKAVMFLNAKTAKEWSNTSCYFNGDAVLVELIGHPKQGESRVTLDRVSAGSPGGGSISSQCGPTEDRVATTDVRVARMVTSPTGGLICTGWLIDDANHMFLSAGHCGVLASDVMEFNCPPSTAGGSIVHPGPEDQYTVDGASRQTVNTGVGNDWSYFGCFANPNTGLTPYQAQGDFFNTVNAPAPANQTTRVTGHGTHPTGVLNGALHTHSGPYMFKAGNEIGYQVDTDNGDSGSPVFFTSNDNAFAIHTNAGCTNPVGVSHNSATDIANANLQAALNNPLGVCDASIADPTGPLFYNGGSPSLLGTVNRDSGMFGTVGPSTAGVWEGLAYNRNADVFYASHDNDGLYVVSRYSGVSFLIGTMTTEIHGLAYNPNNNTLYGYDQTNARLYSINTSNAALTAIGAAQAGHLIGGIDFDPVNNILYGIDDSGPSDSQLVRINTGNGAITVVGDLGAYSDCDSLAYSPDDGFLYSVSESGGAKLLRIDPATGGAVMIGELDQATANGGMASIACDCVEPNQASVTNPANGATGVNPANVLLNWTDPSLMIDTLDLGADTASFSIDDAFRGHILQIDTATRLTEIRAELSIPLVPFPNFQSVTWAVYEFNSPAGNGNLIFNQTGNVLGFGKGKYSSGSISVNLAAGKTYAIGWFSPVSTTFYGVDLATSAEPFPWGQVLGSAAQNFASGLPNPVGYTNIFTASSPTRQYDMEYDFSDKVYPIAGDSTSGAVADVLRGNVVRMCTDKTLTEIRMDLDFVGNQPIRYVIYEGGAPGTDGQIILNKLVNTNGTGRKFYSSGAIAVDLKADRTYAIGIHKNSATINYFYEDVTDLPREFTLGTVESGFTMNSAASVPSTAALTSSPTDRTYSQELGFGSVNDQLNMGETAEDTAAVVANVLRGNVVHCQKDSVLNEIQMRLQFASAQTVNFVVYEATTSGGVGNLVFSKNVNFPAGGEAWHTSGTIAVPMQAGKFYAIGMQKSSGAITYFFENNDDFKDFYEFGAVLGGWDENGFSVPPASVSTLPSTTTYTSRLFFNNDTFYNVLFGTAATPTTSIGVTAATQLSAPGALLPNTKYYWRVNGHNQCGNTTGDIWSFTTAASCYPDCDQDGNLTIDDFICFQTLFALGDPYADCDGDAILTIDDFICFQTLFAIGC